MASVTADMNIDTLSAPYDMLDPSAPAPSQPNRAYVPGTLAQPGESIFGGAAHIERSRDDLDALFADDEDIVAPSRPLEIPQEDANIQLPDHSSNSIAEQRRAARAQEDLLHEQSTGLGIDEEVKQRKPRVPRAKLDHDRLCSDNGIPKLRKITKDRLKFKGKGHEFSDVARMLNTYQLWLDDLFPKAKFADGLAMIEKVGHTKRMQVMRRAWIDESKPRPYDDHEGVSDEEVTREADDPKHSPPSAKAGVHPEDEDEDLYGAPDSLFVPESKPAETRLDVSEPEAQGNLPDADELDMLLAEEASRPAGSAPKVSGPSVDNAYADEEEAMAGMDWY